MIEGIVALSVLVIVATGVVVQDRTQLDAAGHSFDVLAASRFAAGHLDVLDRSALRDRDKKIDLDPEALPGCRAREVVRQIEDGLFEVEVTVHDARDRELARLVTRMTKRMTTRMTTGARR
jgi:hypothetical protein